MARPGWYMLCYDISNPSRLGKVHRIMKKEGISAQKSVFFVQKNEKDMKAFLGKLGRVIKKDKDDIRAYPVESPKKVWTTGGVLETFPLIMPGQRKKPIKKAQKRKGKSLWQRLLGR